MKPALNVVYVDDCRTDREMVRDALMADGSSFQVVETQSRQELESLLRNGACDLLLTDFDLPGFDGLEVLDLARSANKDLPVVILTGSGSEEIAVEAIKRGADDYVVKSPQAIEQLPRRILGLVQQRRSMATPARAIKSRTKGLQPAFGNAAYANAPLAVACLDFQGRFVEVNERFCSLLGYAPEELLGRSFADVTHSADVQPSPHQLKKFIGSKHTSASFPKRYRCKDGRVIWADLNIWTAPGADAPETGPSAVPLYLIAQLQDITERKALEADLARRRSRLAALIDTQMQLAAVPDDIDAVLKLVVDRATELCEANGSAIQFLEDDRLIYRASTHDDIYVRGSALPRNTSMAGLALHEGTALLCEDSETDPRVDRDRCRRTGVRSLITAPMYHGGTLVGILRIYGLRPRQFGPDELELSRLLAGIAGAEIQRRISEQRFRSLTDLSADWYWEQDAHFRFTAVSQRFQECTGLPVSQLLGRTHWELPGIHTSADEQEAIEEAMGARQAFRDCGYSVIDTDGEEHYLEISGEPMFSASGAFAGYRGVGRNVSDKRRTELALRAAQRFSGMTLDALNKHVCVLDEQGVIIAVNRAWREFASANNGRPAAVLEGSNYLAACEGPDAPEGLQIAQAIRSILAGKQSSFSLEYPCHSPQEERWFIARITRFPDDGPVRVVVSHDNITARKKAEMTLALRARQQGLIASFGHRALATQDLNELMNRAMDCVVDGLGVEFAMVLELSADAQEATLRAGRGFDAQWIGQVMCSGQGVTSVTLPSLTQPLVVSDFNTESRFSPWNIFAAHDIKSGFEVLIAGNAGPYGLLGAYSRTQRGFSAEDMDFLQSLANMLQAAVERKGAEDKLLYLARFDALTGLPNRTLFEDRLKQTLMQAQRNLLRASVLIVDLDGFNKINDTLGHRQGDLLLVEVARRLQECVRQGDTVARLSGDEFAILLTDLSRPDDAALVADKIIAALANNFAMEGGEVFITASIGIAVYPGDGAVPDSLLVNADIAMQRAKQNGKNGYQFFLAKMHHYALERAKLETDLRLAIERKEFRLQYQPKVDLASGSICGLEALLRWKHPERGLIPPIEFIPVLEDTGLIVQVGEWVINEVCLQLRRWEQQGVPRRPVAINVSARQFQRTDLDNVIQGILQAHGIDPQLLDLELTESMLMVEPEEAARMLRKLKQRDLRLAVDDFGTGYSSLAYLKRFPLDYLKIDRAFVRDCTSDPEDAAIVLAVIKLAHSLGLKVVAEGVETAAQLGFLRAHGCDHIQGYYFSPPVPADEIATALAEGRHLPSASIERASAQPIVLVVDDNQMELLLFQQALAGEGYCVLAATHPAAALDMLAVQAVDAVISDQRMPGMSGVAFLTRVRKLYPHVARALLTAGDQPQLLHQAVNEAAIDKYFSKDWNTEKLQTEMRDFCRRLPDTRRKS